jgi:anti-sigma factor RsiW
LAYVDGCLPVDQRREFERMLATDQGLAACVEKWRLQNEAIRRTFCDKPPNQANQERVLAEPVAAKPFGDLPPGRDLPRRRESLGRDLRAQVVAPRQERTLGRLSAGRRLVRGVAAPLVAALICILSATPVPTDFSGQLAMFAFSAYRTYAGAAQAEFSSADPAALEQWLRPQLGGWIAVPSLAAGGFALIGGRIAPGAQGPAGFALYKNSTGGQIGLMLESGEASRTLVPRAGGVLVALPLAAPAPEQATLVGVAAAADLAQLATVARFSAEPPQ